LVWWLAIRTGVDDAIDRREAVETNMAAGLDPKEARSSMEQVGGPVVAIALILAAVFVPTAFIPGNHRPAFTSRLRWTIAVSRLIFRFNALSLSPALCSLL